MRLTVSLTMQVQPVSLRTWSLDVDFDARSGREGDGVGVAVRKRVCGFGLELTARAEVALRPGYRLVKVPDAPVAAAEAAAPAAAGLARAG